MSKYATFSELEPVVERKARCREAREYVPIKCPFCSTVFTKIPTGALKSNKASRCKAHLATCKNYTQVDAPPAPPAPSVPPPVAPADEVQSLRAQLATERALRESERALFDQERARFDKERDQERVRFDMERDKERERFDQERDLERAMRAKERDQERERFDKEWDKERERWERFDTERSDAQKCLANVRAWGKFKPPDDTLVVQLKTREDKLDARIRRECEAAFDRQQEINTKLQVELAQINARLAGWEQEVSRALGLQPPAEARVCVERIAKLKRKRTEFKIPDQLLLNSDWARKKSMVAFAPDKQPSAETRTLALPLFQQASAAEPSRAV